MMHDRRHRLEFEMCYYDFRSPRVSWTDIEYPFRDNNIAEYSGLHALGDSATAADETTAPQ